MVLPEVRISSSERLRKDRKSAPEAIAAHRRFSSGRQRAFASSSRLRARRLRHAPGQNEPRRGFDLRRAIVEIDVHSGRSEEGRLGAMPNEMHLVEERVPAAQGADDALVGGRGASGDHGDAHAAGPI